jgi:glycerate 2-kinase
MVFGKTGTGMRQFLENLFRTAIAAADPALAVPAHLPVSAVGGRTIVVGAGKAAASMAKVLEDHWPGDLEGLVITRYGHGLPCQRIEVVEAAHPVPDEAGLAAAARILTMVQGLGADDLVICLISGGGSSLLTAPAAGLTLADKQAINNALLRSGAPITEMNIVRKHLSAIKGGRLAVAAAPARVVTLIISDVPGDDPSVVASGPTVADSSTYQQAHLILANYGITEPAAALAVINAAVEETPKPGDARLAGNITKVIASAAGSLAAVETMALAEGYAVLNLGDRIEGEARLVAQDHAALVRTIMRGGGPVQAPCIILSGGETSVTMQGHGRGGRNSEYVLALAIALEGTDGVYALAGDTDGIDGSEGNAGAWIGPDTLQRIQNCGLDASVALADNDAFTVFEKTGDLVSTGPTLTNVNDIRVILVSRPVQVVR